MDYSYYQNAPQAYQFLGLPPTPGLSTSAVSSEDYNSSPTVRAPFHYAAPILSQSYSHFPRPQSDEFTQNPSPHYSHSHSHSRYQSSPSPHQQSPIQPDSQTQAYLTPRGQHNEFDQFQNFELNSHFGNGSTGLPKAAAPILQHKSSAGSNGHSAPVNHYEVNNYESNNAAAVEAANEEARRAAGNGQGGSNSDDDDMSPAQSRRKAQNRAAQRAFRERKERHVKDLEAKLLAMESASKNISAENERLKVQLQKASTENEILKATSSSTYSNSPRTTSGPLRYSPTDFYSEVLQSHDNKTPSHRIVVSEEGDRLFAAGAAWDYIIGHPLFLRGLVDVGDVSERLKTLARCDGQGPVFEEREIIRAIELSVASGSDELL